MSLRLKPYPEHKDSGLPWAGEIPSHWELVKTKYLFQERVEKGFPNEPLLAATQTKGVISKEQYENRTVLALKDLHLLKLVERGDYVISLRSFQGGVEFAHHRGIISPAYTVLTPRSRARREFFEFFFKSPQFVSSLLLFVTGIRQGQNIDYGRLSRMLLPTPPVEEQLAIGGFLRSASAQIARFIRAKRRLIELLNEQKQAIIHQAVTRGLSPSAPLKASGVRWLPRVPAHWSTCEVGHLARVGNGSTPSRGNSNYWTAAGYPWLNSSSVNQDLITHADQFVTDVALRECHLPRVPTASVLVAITGQGKTRGKAAMLGFESTINQHIAYITLKSPVLSPEFLHLLLTAAYPELRAISDDSGSTKGALTCADLKHFHILLPPPNEQVEILATARKEVERVQVAIARLRSEADLMLEYRTRLIADVVTGKLDVRGVELPQLEEAEEFPPVGDEIADNATEEGDKLEPVEEVTDAAG